MKNNKIYNALFTTLLIFTLSGCGSGANSSTSPNAPLQVSQIGNKASSNGLNSSSSIKGYAYVAFSGAAGRSSGVFSYKTNSYNQILTLSHNSIGIIGSSVSLALDPHGKTLCAMSDEGVPNNKILACNALESGEFSQVWYETGLSGTSINMALAPDVIGSPATNFLYLLGLDRGGMEMGLINLSNSIIEYNSSLFNDGADSAPANIIFDQNYKYAFISIPASSEIDVFARSITDGSLGFIESISSPGLSSPTNMIIDPSNSYLYVLNSKSNQLSIFGFNQSTGELTYISNVTTGNSPQTLAFDSTGQYVYVVNSDNSVSEFQYNSNNGILTNIGTLQLSTGIINTSIMIDPNSFYVYFLDPTGPNLVPYVEDENTGLLSKLSGMPTGNGPVGMITSPSSSNMYVINSTDNTISIYKLIPALGKLEQIGLQNTGQNPVALTMSNSSRGPWYVYTANQDDNSISGYFVNSATGDLRPFAESINLPESCVPTDIAIDYNQQNILVSCGGPINAVLQYRYGMFTPNEQPLAIIPTTTPSSSIVADPSNPFFYVSTVTNASAITSYSQNASGMYQQSGVFNFSSDSAPQYMLIHPSGKYLYSSVINSESDTIEMFSINQQNGTLTSLGSVEAGDGPQKMAIQNYIPEMSHFFVANYYDNTIYAYALNESTGILQFESSTNTIGANPTELATFSLVNTLYVLSSDDDTVSGYHFPNNNLGFDQVNVFNLQTGLNPIASQFLNNNLNDNKYKYRQMR